MRLVFILMFASLSVSSQLPLTFDILHNKISCGEPTVKKEGQVYKIFVFDIETKCSLEGGNFAMEVQFSDDRFDWTDSFLAPELQHGFISDKEWMRCRVFYINYDKEWIATMPGWKYVDLERIKSGTTYKKRELWQKQ